MEIGQGELLVGTVGVVVVLTPAQQQRIGFQLLVESGDDGNRASFAGEDRPAAEGGYSVSTSTFMMVAPGEPRASPLLTRNRSTRTLLLAEWCALPNCRAETRKDP